MGIRNNTQGKVEPRGTALTIEQENEYLESRSIGRVTPCIGKCECGGVDSILILDNDRGKVLAVVGRLSGTTEEEYNEIIANSIALARSWNKMFN